MTPYTVRTEHSPGQPLAVIRRRVRQADLPRVVPNLCGAVWKVIRAEKISGVGRHVAVYLDDEMNIEVGVELMAPFGGHEEVVDSRTPTGTVATTTHTGPYQLLHHAHDAVQRFCAANGHNLAGPGWEIYDNWQDELNSDPAKIVTHIFYLIS